MEIVVAQLAGFCWGVDRALATVDSAVLHARGRPVVALGPIIHNPGVVASVAAKGVTTIGDSTSPAAGSVVVVRAHGLPKSRRHALEALGSDLFDATCPFVARVHREVADAGAAGRFALLVGDAAHAEFRAAVTYARGPFVVVATASDVERLATRSRAFLPTGSKAVGVTLIAQTTLDRATFEAVIAAARSRFADVIVRDTRCDDTRDRQAEVEKLARTADVVVVVGGNASANTARLAAIARGACPKTHLVETPTEVDRAWFKTTARVAVVGGASTPRDDVEAVATAIRRSQIGDAPIRM